MCRDGMAIPMSVERPGRDDHSGETYMDVSIVQRGPDMYDGGLGINRTFILPVHSNPDDLHQLMQQVERMVSTVEIHTDLDYGKDKGHPHEILYGWGGQFWANAFTDGVAKAPNDMAKGGHVHEVNVSNADHITIVVYPDGIEVLGRP